MNFKFEYKCYFKYFNKEGYSLLIDNNNTLEICRLDYLGNIISNLYYPLNESVKKKIKNIISQNREVFNLNSYLFTNNNSDVERVFYFELDTLNRKIETNFLLSENKEEYLLLINIFNKIKDELSEIGIIVNLDELNIKEK